MPAMSPSALRESVTLVGCDAITPGFVVTDGLGVIVGVAAALVVQDGEVDGVELAEPPVEGITATAEPATGVGEFETACALCDVDAEGVATG